MATVEKPAEPAISSLFKADTATLAFSASKDGKLNVNYAWWDAGKVVELQLCEVQWRLPGGRAQREARRGGP